MVREISGSVQNQLRAAIGKYDYGVQGGIVQSSAYATASATSEGQIYMTIGTSASPIPGTNPANLTSVWTGLFDPPTNTWTHHTSNFWWPGVVGKDPFLVTGRPGRQQLYSLGDGATQNCGVVQLENAAYKDAFSWGNSFLRQSNSQNGLVDLDVAHSNALVGIPWVWQTKLVPMSTNARRKAQVKRIFIDYSFDTSDGGGAAFLLPPWKLLPTPIPSSVSIIPLELPNHTINPGQQIGGGPAPRTYGPGRVSFNYALEVSDLFITLQNDGAPSGNLPGASIAEVYGIGIEYQETRDHDGGQ